ncbi:MAG: hypothetical protein DMF68_13615 [Acidobacteria bacterium]|nr:MAG: hypothetical protein DMF68_13615 [Acidobacteriota bacterium]
MLFRVTVEDERLGAALQQVMRASKNPFSDFGAGLGEALHKEFLYMERDWFGSRGEGSWPEDAESTLERKLKALGSVAYLLTLRFTDRLYLSLGQEGAPDSISEISPDELIFGSSVPYGGFHMEPSGKRPERAPIPKQPNPEVINRMADKIVTYAREYVTELGFLGGFIQTSIFELE